MVTCPEVVVVAGLRVRVVGVWGHGSLHMPLSRGLRLMSHHQVVQLVSQGPLQRRSKLPNSNPSQQLELIQNQMTRHNRSSDI